MHWCRVVVDSELNVSVPFDAGRGLMQRVFALVASLHGAFQYPSMRVVD